MANYPGNYAERMRRIQEELNRAMNEMFEEVNHEQNSYTNFNRQHFQGNFAFRPPRVPTTGHYAVLGLQPGATQDEVKKAYRKKAMEHHPDRGGDPKKFFEVQEAYEALAI